MDIFRCMGLCHIAKDVYIVTVDYVMNVSPYYMHVCLQCMNTLNGTIYHAYGKFAQIGLICHCRMFTVLHFLSYMNFIKNSKTEYVFDILHFSISRSNINHKNELTRKIPSKAHTYKISASNKKVLKHWRLAWEYSSCVLYSYFT